MWWRKVLKFILIKLSNNHHRCYALWCKLMYAYSNHWLCLWLDYFKKENCATNLFVNVISSIWIFQHALSTLILIKFTPYCGFHTCFENKVNTTNVYFYHGPQSYGDLLYSVSHKKGNPDLISNSWKTKRRITKLITGNDSTTILLS